jgi:tRNA(Ile)-lysidine synthase
VAYSGGLDSHALLHATAALRDRGWHASAIHIDHGLHPDSAGWAKHCAAVCDRLGLGYHVERVAVIKTREHGPEDAARRARYACLARHIGPNDVLLTAHQQDDQAETVLLQLLRGSGPHGLAAMPALSLFGQGRHGRPLLAFSRAQIERYARTEGLAWIEDPSNRDARIARSLLRAEVFPRLLKRWPEAPRSLARAARHMAEAAHLLDELAALDLASCQQPDSSLDTGGLARLSEARQRNIVRFWIRARGLRAPSPALLEQVTAQVARLPQTRHAVVAWADGEVRRYRDRLVLRRRFEAPQPFVLAWNPPAPLELTGRRLRVVAGLGDGLSQQRLSGRRLTVRSRRGGEICQLAGRSHHTKLKKLLQAAGVPPWERSSLPLMYVDDELAAIGDRWVCEPFRARADEGSWRIVLEHDFDD